MIKIEIQFKKPLHLMQIGMVCFYYNSFYYPKRFRDYLIYFHEYYFSLVCLQQFSRFVASPWNNRRAVGRGKVREKGEEERDSKTRQSLRMDRVGGGDPNGRKVDEKKHMRGGDSLAVGKRRGNDRQTIPKKRGERRTIQF